MSRTSFLTCAFKLYRPNMGKKILLDEIFEEYSHCVYDGLAWGKMYLRKIKKYAKDVKRIKSKVPDQVDTLIETDMYTQNSIYSYLMKMRPKATWNYELYSIVRDDALADVARTLAGYLEVKKIQPNAGYPTFFMGVGEDNYYKTLSSIRELGDNPLKEEELVHNLLRKPKMDTRPILIDHRDVFTILATPDMERYYLFVKLLPARNERKTKESYRGLIDLRTGSEFIHNSTDVALLLPLMVEKGKWQHRKFLAAMLRDGQEASAGGENKRVGPPSLKISRVVNEYGHHDYYANITFGFDVPDIKQPSALMGVSSGVLWSMAFAVTDMKGNIQYKEIQPTGLSEAKAAVNARVAEKQRRAGRVDYRDHKGKAKDQVLHNIANYLIQTALLRNAVLVLADTTPLPPTSKEKRKNWLVTPWKKLCFMIEYKAKIAGVKVKTDMFTAKVSRICPYCAGEIIMRKGDKGIGKCGKCKTAESVDITASINIARRYLYHRTEWIDRGGYMAFHFSFIRGT